MLHSSDLQGRSKRWIANRLGQKVETYAAGVGTLVNIKDGWAIRVRLLCCVPGCKRTHTVYLRHGCGGPDHYAHNFKGEYIADLRNEAFHCGKHTHDKLVKEVEAAILRLNGDTSVSREQTLDSLENVRDLILDLIRDLK